MKKLEEILKNVKTVLIAPSNPPDFDSVGSSLILKKYLESIKKVVRTIFLQPFDERQQDSFSFLPFIDELEFFDTYDLLNTKQFDAVVFIDGPNIIQYYDRSKHQALPNIDAYLIRILFDHHELLPENIANNVFRGEYSSCAELLIDQVLPNSFIDKSIADLAIAAIYADTGNFSWKYSSRTFEIMSWLLEKGGDPRYVIDKMSIKTKDHFRMLSYISNYVVYDDELKATFLYIKHEDIVKNRWNESEINTLHNTYKESFARLIPGYPLGVLVIEQAPGNIIIRARGSNLHNKINLPKMFQELGGNGGGHFNASGANLSGDFDKIVEKLKSKIREKLERLKGQGVFVLNNNSS